MRDHKTKINLSLFFLVLLTGISIILLSAISVSAASSGTYDPVSGVTVTVNGATNTSMSNGVITVTAKGSAGIFGFLGSSKTATITVKNTSGSKAKVSFAYETENVNKFEINSSTTGFQSPYTITLEKDASVTLKITTKEDAVVNKLTLKNFTCESIVESSNVTVQYDSNIGSITADGSSVATGEIVVVPTEGTTFSASSSNFVAWIDVENNNVLSLKREFWYPPTKLEATIKAVYSDATNQPYFMVGTSFFYTFENAIACADASKDTKTVILLNNGILNAGTYTIPSGVTLLVPFDEANTLYTTSPELVTSYKQPTAYRTLTLAEGAKLMVSGGLSVSSKFCSGNGSNDVGGAPTGSSGFIHMEEGSSITVNNGGALYAWGFITGEGSVEALNGATVYELFQLSDFRGGSKTFSMSNRVFPFSQYYVQNIEVPLTLHHGAKEKCVSALSVSVVGDVAFTVDFIGPSGCMFNLTEGKLVKDYIEDSDRLKVTVEGNMTLAAITILVYDDIIDYKINCAEYDLAINPNITVHMKSGSLVVDSSQNIVLLPGTEIIIDEGASAVLNSKVYIFDSDERRYAASYNDDGTVKEWKGFCDPADHLLLPVKYAPGRTYNRTEADLVDAKVLVNGTVTLNAGAYVTAGGANICSSGEGKVIVNQVGTDTEVKLYKQVPDSYHSFAITAAKLQNADGSYVLTNANTFTYTKGKWCCTNHAFETTTTAPTCSKEGSTVSTCSTCGHTETSTIEKVDHESGENAGVVTPPTCTEKGYTTFTCIHCNEPYIGDEVAALGHNMKQTSAKVEPKCGVAGKEAVYTCANGCGYTTGGGEIEALQHSYSSVVTPPTCTTDGYTTHTCSKCGDNYTDSTVAGGHTHGAAVEENRTESTCKVAGSYDSVVYCTECGDELSRTKVDLALAKHTAGKAVEENRVEASCSAEGSYEEVVYCSVCNAELSRTDKVIEKLAHTAGAAVEENRVESTCTDKGSYDSVVKCSVCNTELSRTKVDLPLATHTAGEAVTENNVDPTCTAGGSYDTVVYCTECEAEMSRVTTTVKENGHTSGTPVIENNVDVTCTEDGSYDTVTYCTVCDAELSRVTTIVTHSGHTAGTPAIENNVDATCTEDGSYDTVTYCTVCDAELSRVNTTVLATGHTAGEAVKENQTAASCDEAGSYDSVVYCSVCNEELSRETITVDEIGHSYQGVITTHPTCTEAGVKTFTCSVCNDVYTEPIEKLGHKLTSVEAKAPTCEDDGYEAYEYCSVCTYTTYQKVEATGHSYEAVVTAPTCTAEGYTTYTCSACGDSYVSDNQPAKGHTNADAVIENNVDATCSAQGSYDSVVYCSVCNTEISRTKIMVDALEHQWVDANCTTPKTCSVCGATEGAALGHKWTAATCTSPKTCRVCGETEGTALGHTEAILAGKDATCTETGLTEGKYCSVCNTVITAQEVVPALGHKAVTDEAKAPTCTATGLTEGSHCSVCHEVLKAQETVVALGHDYDYKNATYTWVVNSADEVTCTASAKCTSCEDVKTASGVVSSVTTKEPTCTESGDKEYYAQFDENEGWVDQCGDKAHIETGILSALGHDWGEIEYKWSDDYTSCTATRTCKRENCDAGSAPATEVATSVKVESKETPATCTKDGKTIYTATFTEEWAEEKETEVTIKAPGHDYKSVVTAPTCEVGGYTTRTCTACGDSYITNKTEARGHQYANVVTAPTCTQAGYTTYTCQYTDCKHSYTVAGDAAKGHTAVTDAAVAPTCTEKGKTEGSHCSVCKEVLTPQTDVDALGHTDGEAVVENNVAPTCTEDGHYDSVIYCTVCKVEVSRETVTVKANGHTAGSPVVENNVAPTCTTAGSYENATYCSVCGAETSRETVTVDKLGHTEETIPGKAATCTETGLTDGKKCTVCGETTVAQNIIEKDAAKHTGTTAWKQVDDAYHILTYSCCSATEGEQQAHVPGENGCTVCDHGCDHTYEDVVTEPTCTTGGYTTHTCSKCGYSYQDTETPAGHTNIVTDAAQAPTCTATGLTEGSHCEACEETIVAQTVVAAKGHTEVVDKAVAPTCTETGLTEGKHCSACDEVLVAQTVVAAKGHTEVVDKGYAATCTTTGLTEGKHCSVCNAVLVAQEEVASKGHTEVVDEAVAPTCTATGLTEGKHCSVCGEVLVAQTPIDAKGHTEETIAGKAETCTETGLTEGKKCTVCGVVTVTQQIIPAKGHDYNYVVTTEATCSTPGEETGTCSRCGDKTTKVIPATNKHDYSVIVCDKEYKWKKCSACEATNEKAPRTFRIVFQGVVGSDDEIVLPGVYFYGYNETFIVPEFTSQFFAYEYLWEVDGQKLVPGSTMNVSDLAKLIKTDPTDPEWNTIRVEGGYRVSGLDPNAIMMSMQYENNTNADGDIFLTLSIFVRVEPGMEHKVEQTGGTGLTIKGTQVGNLGLYHYQIPLTAEQMNDDSLKITISYTENGRPVLSKEIGVNLTAYSDALNNMLGEGVTGEISQKLIAATMAYGAALQTKVNDNIGSLTAFNPNWKNEVAAVKVLSTIATSPEYSGEATCLTDAAGNQIPIAKITGANVAMSQTYALLYRYEINLPDGIEPTMFCLILTDEDGVIDRDKAWEGKSYEKTEKIPGKADDGTPVEYDAFVIENVPASEMTVRYATMYVEYVDKDGNECYAYSRTVKYGVVTYLNDQIEKMLSKVDLENIEKVSESDLRDLYLWDNLRTVAMYAEKNTKN